MSYHYKCLRGLVLGRVIIFATIAGRDGGKPHWRKSRPPRSWRSGLISGMAALGVERGARSAKPPGD